MEGYAKLTGSKGRLKNHQAGNGEKLPRPKSSCLSYDIPVKLRDEMLRQRRQLFEKLSDGGVGK